MKNKNRPDKNAANLSKWGGVIVQRTLHFLPWIIGYLLIVWTTVIFSGVWREGESIIAILPEFAEQASRPFSVRWTDRLLPMIGISTIVYWLGVGIYKTTKRNYRRQEEYGSAKWGDSAAINRNYRNGSFGENRILTQHVYMGLDTHKHMRNLNCLVIGGSGAGKTRFYAKPNLMQANSSFIITDPKGELLRSVGGLLKQKGYAVRVFDLIHPNASFCYNPLAYVKTDQDALKLIVNLIRNTTPKNAQNSDPFWEKSEIALLQALILYLLHEAPKEEQNFPMVIEMLSYADVKEEDDDFQSPLDILFERLEMREPQHISVKQYKVYKQAAGKTAKSILVSVGVRLAAFNLPEITKLTMTDEMEIERIGSEKTAVFCCIPDSDTSLNYLVGMFYTQAFQTLYYTADQVYAGRLPVPVHCVMDEFANVALPDDFDKLLATMRSREISVSIILQNLSQLKALFKDSWESLVGNCDSFLYLGGNEKSTHKYVSELLGKETIDTNTYGKSRGRSGSYSTNDQQSGRELLTPDEVRRMNNRLCVLLIRGEYPVLDQKYDICKHPLFLQTADGGQTPYQYARISRAKDDISYVPERYEDYVCFTEEDFEKEECG